MHLNTNPYGSSSHTMPSAQHMQRITHSSLPDEDQLTMELMDGFQDDFVPEDRLIDTPNRQFWDGMRQKADYVMSMNNTFEEEKHALQQRRTQNAPYAYAQSPQLASAQAPQSSYTRPREKESYDSTHDTNQTASLTSTNQRLSTGAPVGLTRLRILSNQVDNSEYEKIMNLSPLARMKKIYEVTQGKTPATDFGNQRDDGRDTKSGGGNQVVENTLAYIPAPLPRPVNTIGTSMGVAAADYLKEAWRRTRPALESVAKSTERSVKQTYQKTSERAAFACDTLEDQAQSLYNSTGKFSTRASEAIQNQAQSSYRQAGELLKDGYRVADNVADVGENMLNYVGMEGAGDMLQEGISSASQLGKKLYKDLGSESEKRYDQTEATIAQAYNQVGNGIKSLNQDARGMLSNTSRKVEDASAIAYDAAKLAYKTRDELAPIVYDVLKRGAKMSNEASSVITSSISAAILDPFNASHEYNNMLHELSSLGEEEFEQFKKKFGGDVHELTDEPVAWVAKNKAHFDDAQHLFGAAEDDIDATALAIAEEMNRNSNVLNRLVSHIQDSIIEKHGVVLSLGEVVRPDVGPGNINTLSARRIVEKLKNHPKANTAELQEILNACRTDESLARYIVTDRGAIMIGAAIMVIEGSHAHPYYVHVKDRDDLVQHKVNYWREGDSRRVRMKNQQAKDHAMGKLYIPKHGYEENANYHKPEQGAHRRNRAKIRTALGRSRIE